MYREILNQRLDALRRQEGLELRTLEVGEGMDEKALGKLTKGLPFALAPELIEFYREMDGLKLSWSVNRPEGELYGGIVILPLRQGLFGYAERAGRAALESAFEDVLWNEESYEEESITELKLHRVFETVEGQPAFVTYKPPSSQLFHVYEEEIDPIIPGFADYVQLLFRYLGGGNLRKHLKSKGWKRKIAEDEQLCVIAGWGE
jgi:hypothetical protein